MERQARVGKAALAVAIAFACSLFAAFGQSLRVGPAVLTPRNVSAVLAALGHTLSGAALKLGNAVDFFSLWAAVMMAFGVAAVGDVPARRALIGTLAAWLCLRLVVSVAMGG